MRSGHPEITAMDLLLLLLLIVAITSLLGTASTTFGAESRDGFA
jgi:hypothetical protein